MLALVLASASVLAGCGGGSGIPEFPTEPDPTSFPGVDYPPHSGGVPAPSGKVWLVGVDGATWDLILPMVESGELPHLRAMMERGASGFLRSERPMISPALWATIATGVPRFEHGVVSFVEKIPGSPKAVTVGSPDRRSPALWELVQAAGGSSVVVGWLGSYPAERIRGAYVSRGFDPASPEPGQVFPPDLLPALEAAVEPGVKEVELRTIGVTPTLRSTLTADALQTQLLRACLDHVDPDLVAVYYTGIDVVEHLTWRHMDPESQEFPRDGPPDPRLAGVIPAYYRFIDRTLGRLRELAGPDADLVVVSDHGHGPVDVVGAIHLRLDVLLKMLGLAGRPGAPLLVIDEMYRHDKRIWLNLVGVEESGTVPVSDARLVAGETAGRLERLRTDTGEPVFASVVDRTREADWRPGEPALVVRFAAASLLARRVVDGQRSYDFAPVRLRQPDVSGGHRPEGILLVDGPGVRHVRLADPSSLYQIAPTVLYLLGLPQDRHMMALAPRDGGVLTAALDPDLLLRRPVDVVAAYPGVSARRGGRSASSPGEVRPDEAAELERLRALGYVQ